MFRSSKQFHLPRTVRQKNTERDGEIECENYKEETKMDLAIPHSQHQFNDSVAAFTAWY